MGLSPEYNSTGDRDKNVLLQGTRSRMYFYGGHGPECASTVNTDQNVLLQLGDPGKNVPLQGTRTTMYEPCTLRSSGSRVVVLQDFNM